MPTTLSAVLNVERQCGPTRDSGLGTRDSGLGRVGRLTRVHGADFPFPVAQSGESMSLGRTQRRTLPGPGNRAESTIDVNACNSSLWR